MDERNEFHLENEQMEPEQSKKELHEVLTIDSTEEVKSKRIIAGFWRRLFAFIFDTLLLAAIGAILGIFFGKFFNQLGDWARLVGFLITLLYFGILNSEIGGGQTISKRAFKIRVVDKDTCFISLKKSLIRTFILSLPVYFADLVLPLMRLSIIQIIVSFITSGAWIVVVYLYIFNKKTRQSLHDILCGTYVIKSGNEGILDEKKLARIHYASIAVLLIITLIAPIAFDRIIGNKLNINLEKLYEIQEKIDSVPAVSKVGVLDGVSYVNEKKTTYLDISFYWEGNPQESINIAKKVSGIVLDTYSDAKQKDVIRITINRGYDIGIFKWNSYHRFVRSPSEWES